MVDPLEGTATLIDAAAGEELADSVGAGENDELATGMGLTLTVTFSCWYEMPVARNDGP